MNARAAALTDDAGIDDHIQSVSGLSDALLKQLRQSLQKIDEINRITRIISMNARIEAVRIGTAGRSFGVIAEEMDTLSRRVSDTAQEIDRMADRTSTDLRGRLDQLQTDVRRTRLTDLALANIDLIDRNLYERSCDVRWWATDAAIIAAAQDPQPAALAQASQRLGQILDSYTVYFDLVLADLQGNVLTNGRPRRYPSAGHSVAQQEWFQSAMATRNGEEFGFQSMHASTLAGGERVLIYACTVREGGRVQGRVLGVLGIVFRWDALAQTIVERTPLSEAEWRRSRVCIVDAHGRLLADTQAGAAAPRLDFPGLAPLFAQPRGAIDIPIDGRSHCVAQAASPGYETYCTGWHCVILQGVD
ncbi:methyl-accepting chemotaxis protein (MCP) signaling protein [Pseudoxanthomonas sp. 3HH-4]|uniref:methyl-accepting chemotaxis protein n=1 Tax=Pseudoxanthomonas sp. 3HH-4 TaxID=1690214 RepID=UPI00114E179F|nr:cache domain-containing protein [Pseudoxanthomonas sp. 3HH-4]TQM06732.1 methyl-accepting chemotaxis protein (MCP) signaling protein [Pseudoxanthomonas sp. 3HH-4]